MKNQLRARGWQFTWNNYTDTDVEYLKSIACEYICWGLEVGHTNHTPHIQGFIYFSQPVAANTVNKLMKQHHCEAVKCVDALINYNMKDGNFYEQGIRPSQGKKKVMFETSNTTILPDTDIEQPYGWQLQVTSLCRDKPDKRSIHWYWSDIGGIGKTTLCKYLCIHMGALLIGGKGDNCRYAVAQHILKTKKHPEIILINIPRSVEHISYTAIEEVKDGCFFSGKYESGMVIYNCPHVFVFANSPPDTNKLSKDRWHIYRIEQLMLKAEVDQTTPHNTLSDVPTDM